MPEYAALDRLQRALNPLPGLAVDGAHQLSVTGTVNIIGGGSGGTSMVDNNPFTPGSTSITPMGGYHGGRTVASGNAAAVQIDGSGNLQVNVVAGGAGGGVANLTVRGSGNQDIHVGYVGGGSVNSDGGAYMPISGTVNVVGGSAFASVAVYGSPANPVYVIGSENVVGGGGSMGVTQIGAPWSVTGSVGVTGLATFTVGFGGTATVWLANQNAGSGFASVAVYGSPANPVYNVGSVNVVNTVAVTTSSLLYADSTNSALRVNVVAGGAGGGGIFGSVGVYGSVLTSGTVTLGTLPLPVFGQGGSLGVTQLGAPWSVTGSVNVSGSLGVWGSMTVVGSVNVSGSLGIWGSVNTLASLTGVGAQQSLGLQVDARNGIVATMWSISGAASGVFQVAPAAAANTRIIFTSFHLTCDGTAAFQWQSPSGAAISGSMVLLPGAGFSTPGLFPNGPVLIGSTNSAICIKALGTQNVGGVAIGYQGNP